MVFKTVGSYMFTPGNEKLFMIVIELVWSNMDLGDEIDMAIKCDDN